MTGLREKFRLMRILHMQGDVFLEGCLYLEEGGDIRNGIARRWFENPISTK